MLEEWWLVDACFHAEFGIDLSQCLHTRSWKWFWGRLRYLMSTDTALRRRFAPKHEPPAEEAPTFEGI